jgi:hypothetical protein
MGLLDDAIREHLELKRRRGAEPGEIARVEREALEPDFGDEQVGWHGDLDGETDLPVEAFAGDDSGEPAGIGAVPADDPDAESAERAHGPDFSTLGQETAELDMRTVLDEDLDAPAGVAPAGPVAGGPARDVSSRESPEADSLEWEVPWSEQPLDGEVDEEPDFQGGGAGHEHQEHQERLSFE